jgi:hypothetical protein
MATAFTSGELVNLAWDLTGAVSSGLQTVSGEQFQIGMDALNELLAINTANMGLIPYFKQLDFNGVIGQEEYFFTGLIQVETLTFQIPNNPTPNDTVRFPMSRKTREDYFATPRANGISSLPYIYHTERAFNGTNIYIYFTPDQPYVFTLWGKFSLAQTVPLQDLSQVYDLYYLVYMRYAVASFICERQNIIPPPSVDKRLKMFEQQIRGTSPTDFTQKIQCPFNGNYSPNYAYANASAGYVPTGWGY